MLYNYFTFRVTESYCTYESCQGFSISFLLKFTKQERLTSKWSFLVATPIFFFIKYTGISLVVLLFQRKLSKHFKAKGCSKGCSIPTITFLCELLLLAKELLVPNMHAVIIVPRCSSVGSKVLHLVHHHYYIVSSVHA